MSRGSAQIMMLVNRTPVVLVLCFLFAASQTANAALSAATNGRGFVIEEKPCHLLHGLASSQVGTSGGSTLRCDNVTVAYVNENYLKSDRELPGRQNATVLKELLLERTISSIPKQYLAVGRQERNMEIFKFVNSNVTNEHFDSLLDKRRFVNLRALDLSDNRISRLSAANHLTQSMGRLRILRLSGNEIERLEAGVFRHLDQLNELYLDRNQLRSLVGSATGVASSLSQNTDESRGLLFANLQSLYVLDLSRNQLDDLSRNVFTGLGKLKTLNLSHNRLTIVPFQVFKPLQEIELMDLSGNELRSILENFFISNKRLKVLRLGDNKIDKITMSSFYGLTRLEELQLTGNNLTYIDRNAFDHLEQLRVLNLRNNQLKQFPTTLFYGLTNLRVLDLSENSYSQLPNGLLSHQLDCLQELYIENNRYLERLDNNLVSRHKETINGGRRGGAVALLGEKALRELKQVSIRGNPVLVDVEKIIFEVMPNVEFLDLSQNQLRQIPKVIGTLKALKTLNVEDNQLTFLPEEVKQLIELQKLDLLGNNYACDCRMFWLPQYLKRMRDLQFPAKAQNGTGQPQTLNQHREQQEEGNGVIRDSVENEYDSEDLQYLDRFMHFQGLECRNGYPGDMVRVLRQLHCEKPVLMASSESEMHLLRSDAILECSFKGNPQPNIIWVTPQNHILRYNPDPDVRPLLMLDNHKYEQKIEFQSLTANVVEDIIEETNKHQNHAGATATSLASLGGNGGGGGGIGPGTGEHSNRTSFIVELGPQIGQEWRQKAGVTVMENGYLKVHNVSRKDSGVYTCYAWNTLGNTSEEIR